jgi:hypothetical protein
MELDTLDLEDLDIRNVSIEPHHGNYSGAKSSPIRLSTSFSGGNYSTPQQQSWDGGMGSSKSMGERSHPQSSGAMGERSHPQSSGAMGVTALPQQQYYRQQSTTVPNLTVSTNSLDSNNLDFGLDLLTNKKKTLHNSNSPTRSGNTPTMSTAPAAPPHSFSTKSSYNSPQQQHQKPANHIGVSLLPATHSPTQVSNYASSINSISGGTTTGSTSAAATAPTPWATGGMSNAAAAAAPAQPVLTSVDLEAEFASLSDIPKMNGPSFPDFTNNNSAATSTAFNFGDIGGQTYEQMQEQKFDYLCKLDRLQKSGSKTSRIYSMSSDLDEIRREYEKIMYERQLQKGIQMQRRLLITCCSGIEFLNTKFDPIGAQLDDWSTQVNDEIESYDDIFTELYDKYQGSGTMAPELRLLFMVGGSAVTYHITKTMFKNMPNATDILNNNPELKRQMQEAALKEMRKDTPGLVNLSQMSRGGNNRSNGAAASTNFKSTADVDNLINELSNNL